MSMVPAFKVVRYGPNSYFLGGELDLATASSLREAVEPIVASGGSLLLDFTAVTFIDSTGINTILDVAKALDSRGCVIIHAAQRPVFRVFELVGVAELPNVHIDACTSDPIPDEVAPWEMPANLAADFLELRALGTRRPG